MHVMMLFVAVDDPCGGGVLHTDTGQRVLNRKPGLFDARGLARLPGHDDVVDRVVCGNTFGADSLDG